MNWRDQYEVSVGWIGKPELGHLRCEVIETWPQMETREPHPVKSVRWAKGKMSRVTWAHSEERYVFAPYHPTCKFVYRGVEVTK